MEGPIFRYKLYDYGGRRNERKKFMNAFTDSNLIYTVSLSSFDQLCVEDDTTNRMLESIENCKDIINHNSFKNVPLFFVFTKYHIFQKKIQTSDLSKTFKDYDGGKDEKKALEFIINKYKSCNLNESRQVLTYVFDVSDDDLVDGFIKFFDEKCKEIQNELVRKTDH